MENIIQERKKVKSSRRSSILKKSPCRLPLEDLNVNNDAVDSRTMGGKKVRRSVGRRVSFAEKPQIKEFNKHQNIHEQLQNIPDGREHGMSLGSEGAENSKDFNIFNMLAKKPNGQGTSQPNVLSELGFGSIASDVRRASDQNSLNRGRKRKSFDINDFVEHDDDDTVGVILSDQTEVYQDCDMSFTECVGGDANRANADEGHQSCIMNETKIFDDLSMDLTCQTFFESGDRTSVKENTAHVLESLKDSTYRASIGFSQSGLGSYSQERLDSLKALAEKSFGRSEKWYRGMLGTAEMIMKGASSPGHLAEYSNPNRQSAFTPVNNHSTLDRRQDDDVENDYHDDFAKQSELKRGAGRKHLFADTIIPFLKSQNKTNSLPSHVLPEISDNSLPSHVLPGISDNSLPSHVLPGISDKSLPSHVPPGLSDVRNDDRPDSQATGRFRQASREHLFANSIISFLRDQDKSMTRPDAFSDTETDLPVLNQELVNKSSQIQECADQLAHSTTIDAYHTSDRQVTDRAASYNEDELVVDNENSGNDLTLREEDIPVENTPTEISVDYKKEAIPNEGETEESSESYQNEANSFEDEAEVVVADGEEDWLEENWLLSEVSDKKQEGETDNLPENFNDVTGNEKTLPTLLSLENDPAYKERIDSIKRQKVEMEVKLAELNRALEKNREDFIVSEEMTRDLQSEFKEIEEEAAKLDQNEVEIKQKDTELEELKLKKKNLMGDLDQFEKRKEELKSSKKILDEKVIAKKVEEAERDNDLSKLYDYTQRFLPWSLLSYSTDQIIVKFFNFKLTISFENTGKTLVDSLSSDAKITKISFEKNKEGNSNDWGNFVSKRLLRQINTDLLKTTYSTIRQIPKLLDTVTEIVLAHEKLYKDLFSVWANNNLSIEDDDSVLISKFISPPQALSTEFLVKCNIDENSTFPKMQLEVDHVFGKDRTEMIQDAVNDTKPGSMLFSRTIKQIKGIILDAHRQYINGQS